jgi:hypothetical protein
MIAVGIDIAKAKFDVVEWCETTSAKKTKEVKHKVFDNEGTGFQAFQA